MELKIPETLAEWNASSKGYLPGHMGIEFLKIEKDEVVARLTVEKHHTAWNGYFHAGSVISLADTACGYGTVNSLPEGAANFTTVELKSNFLGTVQKGGVKCIAKPIHSGRTTQVWDAEVTSEETGKTLAHFRCTQMILWPKG